MSMRQKLTAVGTGVLATPAAFPLLSDDARDWLQYMVASSASDIKSWRDHMSSDEWTQLKLSLLHVFRTAGARPNYNDCWDPAWNTFGIQAPRPSGFVKLAQDICQQNPGFLSKWPKIMVKALRKSARLSLEKDFKLARDCRAYIKTSMRKAFDAVKYTLTNAMDEIGSDCPTASWDECWNPKWLVVHPIYEHRQ